MPGGHYVELLDVANGQYGYVTADDARDIGIDPVQLRLMHHRGLLTRPAYGLYRFPTVPTSSLDQYMEAVLWTRRQAVLSHQTALDLLDLCDVNPTVIHLSVPARYRLRRDMPPMYRLHRRDLNAGDVTRHEGIPMVTVRRAIQDGIESNIGGQLLDQAMDTAKRRGLLSRVELEALTKLRRAKATSPLALSGAPVGKRRR